MDPFKQQAECLVAEAQKKLTRGFLGSLFGLQPRRDEAIDCYQRAASFFKMAKCWTQAGQAFEEAAKLHIDQNVLHDAAGFYIDAANCYKKYDKEEAIRSYTKAIDIYVDMGKFNMAAKCHVFIADLYEEEQFPTEKAIFHLEKAADYFGVEDNVSMSNKCLLKIAHFSAQDKNYEKALTIYENLAYSSLNSTLLKYSAKEYLFKASLCHLCLDVVNALNAVEHYGQIHPVFKDSREYKFVTKLIECVEEQNKSEFTNCVQEYDKVCCLDNWYTGVLLVIKQRIKEKPDLR